jgi:hypothetical protein
MSDELKAPFVFVPEGAPAPDEVRGPEWLRIPATFVPRGGGRLTPSGQPWPCDRNGQEWPKDRLGRPVCPLWDLYPGVRAPGEGPPGGDDPVAAYIVADAVFRDPAAVAGLTQLAATGGRSGAGVSPPSGIVSPAAPDRDKQWLVRTQHGKQPVYDIYVGGLGDESIGHAVLNFAQEQSERREHSVAYFPFDANASPDTAGTALARYIDTLPADAQVNLIGHSYGGDTAAKAVALTTHPVNLLITIDPVSLVLRVTHIAG